MHIPSKRLVIEKIPAFQGREARNNQLILETLATKGPLIKYDIFKELKAKGIKHYPTISRRVDDLKERGYLKAIGSRKIKIGKKIDQSATFGFTTRGIIAALADKVARRNILRILQENAILDGILPQSAYKNMVISIIDGLFDQDELDLILSALFEGFLRAIPENLESLKEEEYAAYILPALIRSPKISDTFSGKDFTQLLQIEGLPEFLLGFIENYERVLKQSLEAIQLIKTHILAYPAKLPKQSNKPVNP